MGKASALSWSESESKKLALRRFKQLDAFSTMGSSSSEGNSLELLQVDSSTSDPDNSPSSEEEEAEEEEEEA